MLNHTEMHSDNKMRESMKEGWVVGVEVGWRGRRRSREGGKNEPEKLLGWGVGGRSRKPNNKPGNTAL